MFIPQEYLNSPACFGVISMDTFSLSGRCLRILKSGKTTSSRQLEESLRIKFIFVVLSFCIDTTSGEYPPSTIISTRSEPAESTEPATATSFFSFFIRKNQNTKTIPTTPDIVTIVSLIPLEVLLTVTRIEEVASCRHFI